MHAAAKDGRSKVAMHVPTSETPMRARALCRRATWRARPGDDATASVGMLAGTRAAASGGEVKADAGENDEGDAATTMTTRAHQNLSGAKVRLVSHKNLG